MTETTMTHEMKRRMAKEIATILINLNAPSEILFAIGSFGDTQDDEDVIQALEQYNEKGTYVHELVSPAFKWEPKR